MRWYRPPSGRRWALPLLAVLCALAAGGCALQMASAGPGRAQNAAGGPSAITADQRPVPGHDRRHDVRNAGDSREGIEGQISFGPISPVARPGVANYRPYQATITVLDQNGHAVVQFQSDADGNFRQPLEPGRYVLDPQSPGSRPGAAQQVIVVHPGEYTRVRINYDSGIR
jgi:hypothetical protein